MNSEILFKLADKLTARSIALKAEIIEQIDALPSMTSIARFGALKSLEETAAVYREMAEEMHRIEMLQ